MADLDSLIPADNRRVIAQATGTRLARLVRFDGSNALLNMDDSSEQQWHTVRSLFAAGPVFDPPQRVHVIPAAQDANWYAHNDTTSMSLCELDSTPGTLTWYNDADIESI